jgi:O-antigen ligase/tetratricopeptide (TPR) repeat protein
MNKNISQKVKSSQNGLKLAKNILFVLTCLSLLAPLWTFKDLLFPYVTSKAFYFRIVIELGLPVYVYLLIVDSGLRPKWKDQYLNWFIVFFLVCNIISSFAGIGVTRSLCGNFERMGGAFYVAHLTALYFYIVCLGQMGRGYLKWFLNSFLGVALLITINGIFGKLGLPTLVMDPSLPGRVSSTLGNPIYLGSFLVVPIFIALFLGKQAEEKFKASLYYISAGLFFIGLLLSGTRGALVGIVGGVFLSALAYIIFTPSKKIKIFGSLIVGFFVAVYVLLSVFNSHLPEGSQFKRLFNLNDSNTQARLIQWKVALTGYKERPVLGIGPENYYYISNKYYNPEIFKYDRSWFDKPHNYLIEILVTTGAVGFFAYLGILLSIIWALYKGYKNEFLSLFEFCALLSGLFVYQIQNLTVFDTVPASLAFYSLVGLAGYILTASIEPDKNKPEKGLDVSNQTFAYTAGGLMLVVMIYVIYATNITPMKISSLVNYGFAYSSIDPQKADNYFQEAVNLPFNFDKTQTAQKYAEFSSNLSRSELPQYKELSAKVNSETITVINDAITYEKNYPILWQSLAEAYLFKNFKDGNLTDLDPAVYSSINKAIELVPGRQEPYLTLAQIKALIGDIAGAQAILQKLADKFPTDYNSTIQLASIERLKQNYEGAIKLILEAQKKGYKFSSYGSLRWIVDYYFQAKQYEKALEYQKLGQDLEPNNVLPYTDLARIYAATGKYDLARNLATNIMNSVTSTRPQMQALIDSLPKNGAVK